MSLMITKLRVLFIGLVLIPRGPPKKKVTLDFPASPVMARDHIVAHYHSQASIYRYQSSYSAVNWPTFLFLRSLTMTDYLNASLSLTPRSIFTRHFLNNIFKTVPSTVTSSMSCLWAGLPQATGHLGTWLTYSLLTNRGLSWKPRVSFSSRSI